MTAPQISPFVVDQTRLGGAGSAQRHGFNIMSGPRWKTDPAAASAPAEPRQQVMAVPQHQVEPPPMRLGDLGYGLMAAPELSPSQIKELQAAATPIVEAIRTELEALKMEGRILSPESLRENPDIYKTSELGAYLTPQEMRTHVITATKAVQAEATRVLSGAIASYLTDGQVTALHTAVDDAKALVAYLQQFDIAPVTGAKSKISDDEIKQRLSDVRNAVANAEKSVVSSEAPSVPVSEQPGGLGTVGTILAVGILAAVGWYLYEQM